MSFVLCFKCFKQLGWCVNRPINILMLHPASFSFASASLVFWIEMRLSFLPSPCNQSRLVLSSHIWSFKDVFIVLSSFKTAYSQGKVTAVKAPSCMFWRKRYKRHVLACFLRGLFLPFCIFGDPLFSFSPFFLPVLST